MEYSNIISEQPFGSSKKIQLINMTPMESLLTAIDSAYQCSKRRRSPSPQQQAMSIKSILDNDNDDITIDNNVMHRPFKRRRSPFHYNSPPPLYNEKPMISTCSRSTVATMTCYHASIAQKSYGTEKRFLCPPPIVMISNTTNQNPLVVSMSVVCETTSTSHEGLLEQRTLLDDDRRGSFKYLFVTGTAKAKQFCLRVNLTNSSDTTQQMPYASFYSNPISIISKPSKKTAKARNVSTCLFTHSYVSLFNRINSQTVRTKYMTTENNQLCAKHSSWSPFEIIVVSRPNNNNKENQSVVTIPITYGTEIILKDLQTGTSSPPLIIRKVDKGRVVSGACGLLNQMQKIALQLASTTENDGNTPLYLNANGTPINPQPQQQESTATTTTTIESSNTSSIHRHTNAWIDFVPSKLQQQEEDDIEILDDYLCWTIVGISKFEHTYSEIDNSNNSSSNSHVAVRQLSPPPSPPRSIIPYPVLSSIHYSPSTHSLAITGQNLIEPAPHSKQLDFWLGSYGPLPSRFDHSHDDINGSTSSSSLSVMLPDTQELLVIHHDMLVTRPDGARYFELPVLLVRHDGFTYYSGKTLACDIDAQYETSQWSVHDATTHPSNSSVISSSSAIEQV
ncbi:MAG: hypothetical protein EXX96DRAFT_563419 [Benjaminiella poitrasii]|nr:MAG: hypothetical protein EXX96DRAFT_563419 [Benjaminiella poitrasii]